MEAKVASSSACNLGTRPVSEVGIIAQDIPLLPVSDIINSAQAAILSGHLRTVYSLRLELVSYPDPANQQESIAFPAWVLLGDDQDAPRRRAPAGRCSPKIITPCQARTTTIFRPF